MSRRTAKAKICWVPLDAGGRTSIPSGPTYSTVARFDLFEGARLVARGQIVGEEDLVETTER